MTSSLPALSVLRAVSLMKRSRVSCHTRQGPVYSVCLNLGSAIVVDYRSGYYKLPSASSSVFFNRPNLKGWSFPACSSPLRLFGQSLQQTIKYSAETRKVLEEIQGSTGLYSANYVCWFCHYSKIVMLVAGTETINMFLEKEAFLLS